MPWLDGFFSELGAKRRRLRKALGDWRASLFEALALAGFAFGLIGPALHPKGATEIWWGLLPPAGFLLGLIALEARRRRQIDSGAPEEALRRGHDRLCLALAIALPLIGAALFWLSAATEPAPVRIEVPETVPEDAIEFDLSRPGGE